MPCGVLDEELAATFPDACFGKAVAQTPCAVATAFPLVHDAKRVVFDTEDCADGTSMVRARRLCLRVAVQIPERHGHRPAGRLRYIARILPVRPVEGRFSPGR